MRILLSIGLLAALCMAEDPAIAKLESATRDVDRGVRFAAVEALGKAGAGIDAVVAALDDPEWCVRQVAGRALSNMGEAALPALERIMRTGKPLARVEAVEAARRIGAKGAAIVFAALDDTDVAVRRDALDGIALIGKVKWSPEQLGRLRKLARSDDPREKLNACMALRFGEPGDRELIEEQVAELRVMIEQKTVERDWVDELREWLKPVEPPEPPVIDLEALESVDESVRGWELANIRRMGVNFKQHEEAIAKLLDSEEEGVPRDAAVALELIGADAVSRVVDHAPLRAAYASADPTAAQRKSILNALEADPSDAEVAMCMLLLGRMGQRDEEIESVLRESARSPKTPVRANAIWALGEIGIPVPESLADRSLAVREIALPYIEDVPRLIAILNGTHREARMLAARRLGQLRQFDSLLAVSSHPDPLVRIAVAQALGERCPAVYSKDESRDVRIAAANVLRGPVLLSMLRDKNWRVRAAAVRSLGHTKLGSDQLALLLGSRNYAIGIAAFESLRRIGPRAAVALGRAVDNGNEAVWRYAPKLFDSFGGAGAAGVPSLIDALKHPNPTARECAVRCLASMGPDAQRAVPALLEALTDKRLAVVSHAALALGKIGITEPLLAGLASERARVRAYSAFAIGWALAARRGFDQAPFQPRLPVLDSGEPEPKLTVDEGEMVLILDGHEARKIARTGIWSKNRRIAYACASVLKYDTMSPRECERAVEIVMAEGFRKGHPFDFDFFRAYLGSDELLAALQMVTYARDCDPPRTSIHGDFHRMSRAEHIPGLLWFERNEDAIRLKWMSELCQPFSETERYRAERSSGDLWKDIEKAGGLHNAHGWWLRTEPIPESRESTLIGLVDAEFVPGQPRHYDPLCQQWPCLRAMGRATGDVSLRYLRWASELGTGAEIMARASLARRKDPVALVRMVEDSIENSMALALLIEQLPDLGMAIVRERLSNPVHASECAWQLADFLDADDAMLDVRWDPDRWVGIEPALPVSLLNAETLMRVVRGVPGCYTKRVARAAAERLQEYKGDSDWWDDQVTLVTLARLHAVAPGVVLERVRGECDDEDGVFLFHILARLRDPADEQRVVESVSGDGGGQHAIDAALWGTPAILKAMLANDETDEETLALAQCGFHFSIWDDEDPARADWIRALRSGEGFSAARALFAEEVERFWQIPREAPAMHQPWMKEELQRRYDARELGRSDVLLGSLIPYAPEARVEYWSAMRSGRYRWVNDWQETHAMTLGFDFATLPFWAEELESNCCRNNPRIDVMFDDLFGIDGLNSCSRYGAGQPSSRRVRAWFELYGGEPRWSKLAQMFVPEPE